MTDTVQQLKQERQQMFEDLYHGRIPKRVPITIKVNNDFGIQYAGLDLVEAQWHPEKMEEAAEAICRDFFADRNPFGSRRFPAFYTFTKSTYFKMGSNGFLQHPEIAPMKVEEYPEFIDNPYDYLIEKLIPRLYPALDTDENNKALTLAISIQALTDDRATASLIGKKMNEKYGYFEPVNKAAVYAPFDFVADVMRGFKGILTDIKRYPEQVAEACEAILPLMVKVGTPKKPSVMGDTYVPLHMAPYMREKDFAKFYWPTFKKMVEAIMAAGQGISFFCEHDWSRYLDYLQDLPAGVRMRFEYGDPRLIKEKLGDKHIISGFYPVSMFSSATQQECLDKAKELLDILAPGGNCCFDVDKVMATYDGGKENYIAVLNLVKEYGRY
ncbi:MAG TPA: uroporphyrinogen decarboxylase [Firmicutes bacterium]|nr:uroporphyrinogen decarboxylase [Bacillota bacterium]